MHEDDVDPDVVHPLLSVGLRAQSRLDASLELLGGVAAAESRLFAMRAQALLAAAVAAREVDREAGHELSSEFLPVHVAGTLTVQQVTAEAELAEARHLVVLLPRTWQALDEGTLRVPQARVLVEQTLGQSPAVCAQVESELLPWLADRSVSQVRRKVRRVLLRLEGAAQAERARRRAVAERGVSGTALPDGMAGIWATMPAGASRLFLSDLREVAKRAETPGDVRTAAQRESDVLAALPRLVLDGLRGRWGEQAQQALAAYGFRPGGSGTQLTSVLLVPAATALGSSDEPAELVGHGPISPEHARVLLGTSTARIGTVDPVTGRLLAVGDAAYRPDVLGGADSITAETRQDDGGRHDGCGQDGREPGWRQWLRSQVRELIDVGDPDGDPGGVPAVTGADSGSSSAADAHPTGIDVHRLVPPAGELRYRPSVRLRRFLQLRDPTCIGIGCSTRSAQCDIEHRVPWPAGSTDPENTAPVSRRCHRAKQSGWSYRRARDGTTTWTAPSGRSYRRPADTWPTPVVTTRNLAPPG